MYRVGVARLLIAFLLLGVLLPAANVAAAPRAISLVIWHSQTGGTETALQLAVSAYDSAHPEVNIFLVNKGSSLKGDFDGAVPSGTGPDLLIMGSGEIGDEAVRGNILPLDYFGVNLEYLRAAFEEPASGSVIWRGNTWGLPLMQSGIALIINKALVSTAYMPSGPHDFIGLQQKAQQFFADTGKRLVCNPGFGDKDQPYYAMPIFLDWGVKAFVDDFGKSYLTTAEAQSASQWLLDIKPFLDSTNSYNLCHDRFLNGEVGMWWNGPWAMPEIVGAGIDYDILPMGAPYVGTDAMIISLNAIQRGRGQQAIDLAQFLTGEATAKQIALQGNSVPANSLALQDSEVKAVKWIAGFSEALRSGTAFPNNPYLPCQWQPVGKAVAAIWDQTKTIQQALTLAKVEIEACAAVTKTIPFKLFLAYAVR